MLLSLGSTSTNGTITELPPTGHLEGLPEFQRHRLCLQEGKPRGRSRDDGHVIMPCSEFRATFQKPPKALPGHKTSLLESPPTRHRTPLDNLCRSSKGGGQQEGSGFPSTSLVTQGSGQNWTQQEEKGVATHLTPSLRKRGPWNHSVGEKLQR